MSSAENVVDLVESDVGCADGERELRERIGRIMAFLSLDELKQLDDLTKKLFESE